MDKKDFRQENIIVIKKEMQLIEVILNQGNFNKKNKIPDLHNDTYYVNMCLYHKSLKNALEMLEKDDKIVYH